jgi:hypothetical protein
MNALIRHAHAALPLRHILLTHHLARASRMTLHLDYHISSHRAPTYTQTRMHTYTTAYITHRMAPQQRRHAGSAHILIFASVYGTQGCARGDTHKQIAGDHVTDLHTSHTTSYPY